MPQQIVDLFTLPQHLPLVANWIHAEFWADGDEQTPESLAKLLRQATVSDAIPLSLLAVEDDVPVGTINLIENDDDARQHLRPWLAALYVVPENRQRGVGSTLVRTLQQRAASMDIVELYLGTDNPGFYERLGAAKHEQAREDLWIMRLSTAS